MFNKDTKNMNVTTKLLRSFNPCYDPSQIGIKDDLNMPVIEFVDFAKDIVESKEDLIWVICRKDFMSDRDLRLFAVWCAREALKLVDNPDERSINACNVSEAFANGEVSIEELTAAEAAAETARDTARDAAWAAARDAQIEQLKTYFK